MKVSCNKCGKSGHIKKNYRTKPKGGVNFVHEAKDDGETKWKECFSIEVIDQPSNKTTLVHHNDAQVEANVSTDYQKEWIIDSGCSHHATCDATLLSNVRPHERKRAIATADNTVHPITLRRSC